MLNITRDTREDGLYIILKGEVDEYAEFPDFSNEDQNEINVDLYSVESINSLGIRNWVTWARGISENIKTIFHRVPPIIIDSMNVIADFMPKNCKVHSFLVPYESEVGNEKLVEFISGQQFEGSDVFLPPKVIDEDTGDKMEIGVLNSYFKFLKRL